MSRPAYLPLPLVHEDGKRVGYRSLVVRCMGRLVKVVFYGNQQSLHAYEFKVMRGKPFRPNQLTPHGDGDLWGWGWKSAGPAAQKLRGILLRHGLIDEHGHLIN